MREGEERAGLGRGGKVWAGENSGGRGGVGGHGGCKSRGVARQDEGGEETGERKRGGSRGT